MRTSNTNFKTRPSASDWLFLMFFWKTPVLGIITLAVYYLAVYCCHSYLEISLLLTTMPLFSRLQALRRRQNKQDGGNGAGVVPVRGTYRRKRSEGGETEESTTSKSSQTDTTIFGVPTLYLQVILITMTVLISAVIIFRVPVTPPDGQAKATTGQQGTPVRIGGWRLADSGTNELLNTALCTIDRRNAHQLSSAEFEEKYRFKKPVIVTFKDGASAWTNPAKWTVNSLKEEYGEWAVVSGRSQDIVRHGGRGDVQTSFNRFLEQLMDDRDDVGEPL